MCEPAVIAPWIAAVGATITTVLALIFGFRFNKRLEQVKSQLSLQSHLQRVKFEKEFQVLQEVWSCLVDLHNAGEAFTPGFKSGFPDESQCRTEFIQAYVKFLTVINVQKPFFPQEVFSLLENYWRLQLKYFRGHQFITQPDFKHDWVRPEFWDKREEHLKDIEKLAEDVCGAIRKRTGWAKNYADQG